jgi:hypothetical protein
LIGGGLLTPDLRVSEISEEPLVSLAC